MEPPAAPPDDRITRLNRALRILAPYQEIMTVMIQMESCVAMKIQETERKMHEEVRRTPSSVPAQLQQDIVYLRGELNTLQVRRQNILTMVYNTIRDTYNNDADPASRVDFQPE